MANELSEEFGVKGWRRWLGQVPARPLEGSWPTVINQVDTCVTVIVGKKTADLPFEAFKFIGWLLFIRTHEAWALAAAKEESDQAPARAASVRLYE